MNTIVEKLNIEKDFRPNLKNGWAILGPGGGGTFFVPTVSPHDPKVMMMACDMTDTYITNDAGATWQMLNLDGRVDAIAFDPVREGVIYAGAAALYRSTDNGVSWELIFPRPELVIGSRFLFDESMHIYTTEDRIFEGGRIQKIFVDPKNPDHIYIGAAKGLDIGLEGDSLHLFVSTDDGASWREAARPEGRLYMLIDFLETPKVGHGSGDQAGNRDLLIVTNTSMYAYNTQTHQLVPMDLPNEEQSRQSIAMKKADPMYAPIFKKSALHSEYLVKAAASGVDPRTGQTVLYIVSEMRFDTRNAMCSGVFRSCDSGKTWVELKGLDMDFAGPANGQMRFFKAIAVSYYQPDTVYLSIWRHPEIFKEPMPEMNYQGIVVSRDGGKSWEWSVKMDDRISKNVDLGWFEEAYDTDWLGAPWFLGVSATNPDVCLAACQGFSWLTQDGGRHWRQNYCDAYEDGTYYGKNVECTSCHNVLFDPFDRDAILFAYTDNGMLKSKNCGKTWYHAIKGVPNEWINTCYDVAFDPAVKGLAWGVWSSVHDLPRSKMFARGHFNGKPIYGGVCVTDNCAELWHTSSEGLPERGAYTSILLDPDSPVGNRTLYVTQCPDGVYKSTDNGRTWALKSNGLGENKYAYQIERASDGALYLVVMKSRNDDENITEEYRNDTNGAIYKSTDGAESWQRLTLTEGVYFPNKLDIDPSDPKRLYFTAWPSNLSEDGRGGGVYCSEDGGLTWLNIFDEKVRVFGVQVDPRHTDSVYIVTFEHTAYRSDDRGKNWKRLRGYNFKWGQVPVMDPHNDDMLYITTFGGSVFYGPKNGGDGQYDDIKDFIFYR